MSRSIDLGRALLSSQSIGVELWLTTSIAVSPQQPGTNLQQLTRSELLQHLLAKDFWVIRANGMRMTLHLTIEGEPLGREYLHELAPAILHAPAWSQLGLRPSLRTDSMGEDEFDLDIGIDYSERNVPGHVNPPDGVTCIAMQSIQLSMHLTTIKGHGRFGKSKGVGPPERHCDIEFTLPLGSLELDKLVGIAMRFAICNGLPRSSHGVTIKANSFLGGLADVAPALWDTGYRSAVSQRARLLPALSRSFARISTKAKSDSLLEKTASLLHPIPPGLTRPLGQDVLRDEEAVHMFKLFRAQFWVQMQASIKTKSTIALGPLYLARDQLSNPSDSDDFLSKHLEETDQRAASLTDSRPLINDGMHGAAHSQMQHGEDHDMLLDLEDAEASATSRIVI